MTSTGKNNWVNVLQAVTTSLNNTQSKLLGMSPTEAAKPKNQNLVFHKKFHNMINSKPKVAKFSVGQPVYVAESKLKLGWKGYTKNYLEELFFISQIIPGFGPIRYKLIDKSNETLNTSFYEPELASAPEQIPNFKLGQQVQLTKPESNSINIRKKNNPVKVFFILQILQGPGPIKYKLEDSLKNPVNKIYYEPELKPCPKN